MTRNCPKIHFNIVKNYVSAERKVIRHVINDVITSYTEPRGVDTTLDDFVQKTNFKYPYKKGNSHQGTAHILTSSILFFNQLYC